MLLLLLVVSSFFAASYQQFDDGISINQPPPLPDSEEEHPDASRALTSQETGTPPSSGVPGDHTHKASFVSDSQELHRVLEENEKKKASKKPSGLSQDVDVARKDSDTGELETAATDATLSKGDSRSVLVYRPFVLIRQLLFNQRLR